MKLTRNTASRASLAGAILFLAGGLAGCDSEPEAPAAEAPAPTAEAPAAEKPAPAEKAPEAPAGPSVSDPSFDLVLASVGPYKAGELGTVSLTLKPKGIYHVNQDYPINITFSGPSELSLAKSTFEKGDAAEFGETVAKFDVPVTPSAAGEHKLLADVDFAVCTEETCVPDRRKLALDLTVE